MRKLIVFTISLVFALSAWAQSYESATEGASESNVSSQRTSTGYEYYDASGNLTGHSERAVDGSYIYYDAYGAQIGTIEGDAQSGYTVTDVLGGEVGGIEETPSGKYRYQSDTEGGLSEVDVLGGSGEDISIINPEAFSQEELEQ